MPAAMTKAERIAVFHSRYIPEPNTGCWIWTAARRADGYGKMSWNGPVEYAHRIAWLLEYGAWPERILDHLCRMPSCVNPKHLEDVSHRSNLLRGVGFSAINARKTHCPQGHVYDKNHRYRMGRYCSLCNKENQQRIRDAIHQA